MLRLLVRLRLVVRLCLLLRLCLRMLLLLPLPPLLWLLRCPRMRCVRSWRRSVLRGSGRRCRP